jgi:hypothetical protein
MVLTILPEADRIDPRGDDYLVEGKGPSGQPAVGLQIIRVLQGLLVIVLALLSISVMWVVGLMLGIF